MDIEEFKSYIDSIKDTPKFKNLNDFLQMTKMPGKDIYESIRQYLSLHCSRRDTKEYFQPDFEYFKKFMDTYLQGTSDIIEYNQRGRVDLSKTMNLVQPFLYCDKSKKGVFFDGWIIMTDGSKYICKVPLYYKPERAAGITDPYSIYIPIIASQISKQLGVETAEFILAEDWRGSPKIMSKNFLKENEEMVLLGNDDEATDEENLISYNLKLIDEQLRNRRFPESQIENTKFEFLKQEFVAKLIGLKDQKYGNSPIITGVNEQGKKYVKMSPMLDYDFSFHIAEREEIDLQSRECDNGKTDIASFIEQYKNYPGFYQFLNESINRLNMDEVFKIIFDETGMPEFEDYKDNPQMMEFADFVNKNLNLARQAIGKDVQERDEL